MNLQYTIKQDFQKRSKRMRQWRGQKLERNGRKVYCLRK